MSGIALIAEDDDLIRTMLRCTLEAQGYQVFEASDGQQCLSQYEQLCPNIVFDIIFLDCVMPVMDGYRCCEALRKQPGAEHTPIVMITGQDDSASIQRAFDAGVTDYILKPIQWNIFSQRIHQLIKQTNLLRQLADQNAEYQQTMMVDDLTQVLNQRAFNQYLEWEWNQGLREGKPLSIILTDIDFFKIYKDAYGSIVADQHLQQITQVMRQAVYRSSDLVCRYGSEELGILLPNTPVDGAIHVATRIQNALKDFFLDSSFTMDNAPITLSYGLSSIVPCHSKKPIQLREAASKALYRAKSQGQNHSVVQLIGD